MIWQNISLDIIFVTSKRFRHFCPTFFSYIFFFDQVVLTTLSKKKMSDKSEKKTFQLEAVNHLHQLQNSVWQYISKNNINNSFLVILPKYRFVMCVRCYSSPLLLTDEKEVNNSFYYEKVFREKLSLTQKLLLLLRPVSTQPRARCD